MEFLKILFYHFYLIRKRGKEREGEEKKKKKNSVYSIGNGFGMCLSEEFNSLYAVIYTAKIQMSH